MKNDGDGGGGCERWREGNGARMRVMEEEREKVGHSKRANNKGEKQYTVTKQECVQSVQSITCVSSPQRGYLPL